MIIKFKDFLLEKWSNQDRIRQIKTDDTIFVYEDEKIKVIIPKTLESACIYGSNTTWCYASNDELNLIKNKKISDSTFGDYVNDDVIYIFIMKKENKKYTFRFESGNFVDETGEKFNISTFLEDFPKLKQILENHINNEIYFKYPYKFIHLDYLNSKPKKKLIYQDLFSPDIYEHYNTKYDYNSGDIVICSSNGVYIINKIINAVNFNVSKIGILYNRLVLNIQAPKNLNKYILHKPSDSELEIILLDISSNDIINMEKKNINTKFIKDFKRQQRMKIFNI